jgi:hypothetical protein
MGDGVQHEADAPAEHYPVDPPVASEHGVERDLELVFAARVVKARTV